jgi:RNA polymerase sigma factor (sigma-70 family)
MDESRAAGRKALADAAHRPSGEDVSDLLRDLEAAPEAVAEAYDLDDLACRAQAGDLRAREELIERMLPLVNSISRRYRAAGLERADLVQEGCVGVLRALQRFDPDRGVPFSVYAALWIRQALQELRSDFIRPFRLPPKALRQLGQLKSAHYRIHADEHRDASLAELATATTIDLDQVEALVRADASTRSVDEPVGGLEGEFGTLGDLLEDPLSGDQYEQALEGIAGRQLRALLGYLTERERDIVDSRFGFERPVEKLTAIGSRLGISAERVRQIEERALTKMRQASDLQKPAEVPGKRESARSARESPANGRS